MKLFTLLLVTLCFSIAGYSQRATLENDTAKYLGHSYTLKDTITLGYGSKSNKDFAFISQGSALTGVTDLQKEYSKNEAVIEKIYKKGKSVYIRAKVTDKAVNALGGNKLFIDLEGAIDNKELK